jgi:hypothetical protein
MKKILVMSVFVAGALAARADDPAAFQLSLTPSAAIQPSSTQINGLSLNIWGENPQSGVAFGFINGSTGESKGFSWGLYNYDESYTGVQWGLANYSEKSFVGWQDGLVNLDEGYSKGFIVGLVNYSDEMHGLQVGVFNYADDLNGVQIGLLNVANDNDWFTDFPNQLAKGFVLVNWSF